MALVRRAAVVAALTVLAVVAAGPVPDLNPLPECAFGCEIVPLSQ